MILNWLQNDGTRGFFKDQLKGKQLLPTFQPDALVVFTLALKMTRASGQNVGEICFPLSRSLENTPNIRGIVFLIVNKINVLLDRSEHGMSYIHAEHVI